MCEIANIKFTNCIWNAPVPITYENLKDLDNSQAGAIVFKTITLNPTQGDPDNWSLTDSGSKNSVKLHNGGVEDFIRTYKRLKPSKPVFVSIYGPVSELRDMIRKTNELKGKILVEWNISCPNAPQNVVLTKEIVRSLWNLCDHPFGIKISYDQKVDHLIDEVDFITAINTIAGYGGRIIHKKAIKVVRELSRKTTTPIIGSGGADCWDDVERFRDAGAIAVEMGTAYLRHGVSVFEKPEDRRRLINKLHEYKIIKYGDFIFKSGQKSNTYIDFRSAFSFSDLWEMIILQVLKRIKNLDFDLICGVPTGAIPLASIIALRTRKPLIMCRSEPKKHGLSKMVEGVYERGDRVLLVEDVVTTGFSLLCIADILRQEGLKVKDAICLLNRGKYPRVTGIECRSLFRLSELVKEDEMKVDHNTKTKLLLQYIEDKRTRVCFSADISDPEELLKLLDKVGPHICMVKLHYDTLENISDTFSYRLYNLMTKHKFMLFEDRKLFDIGSVVGKQFETIRGTYCPDFVTSFLSDQKGIKNLISKGAKLFLIAQMSSVELDPLYTRRVVEFARENSVCGIIAQERLCDDVLHLVPGVHLSNLGDKLGQVYRTPEDVKDFADVIIIGRGIYEAKDPVAAVIEYKERMGV